MQSLYRYAFGLVVLATSCGQILDVDADYVFDPNAGASAICGDGVVTDSELCDDGNKVDADGCDSNCTPTVCGNGIVTAGEDCDDANSQDNDECTSFCTSTYCGDGIIKINGEQCDDGNMNNGDGCSSACQTEDLCGDGQTGPNEICDDGNTLDGDGCDSNCTATSCGNNIVTILEECDDGNTTDGDGCSSFCAVEEFCGNGKVDGLETCDDANLIDSDGCDSNCTITSCGNGIVTTGESCDDGNTMNGDGCNQDCSLPSFCGNGVLDPMEECDDGNQITNDACSNACRITPQSCVNLAQNCGPFQNESCCTSIALPGGTYNRINNSTYPATVDGFRLDRFEVTVGRFRKFIEAYPASKPAMGAGAHPAIAQSGWNLTWDANMPIDQTAFRAAIDCSVYSVWTDVPADKEVMPINCVKWYEAFAFCAWDGGRLPTEAEWNYAAAGGNQQRYYPWSNPPSSMTINQSYANYNCYGDGSVAQDCKLDDIIAVGSRSSLGDGFWGHADLGGSVLEWTLDLYDTPLMNPCVNCANLVSGTDRVARGGNWGSGSSFLANNTRDVEPPGGRDHHVGLRCARPL